MTDSFELAELIATTVKHQVAEANTVTRYREPLIGFAVADDPRFPELRRVAEPSHLMPQELLLGARSIVAFFLPFERQVLKANAQHRDRVAPEWAVAYVETNALIGHITARLIQMLAERGVRAAGEPATDNFDPVTLISRWSHKSVAVVAGLGSFGLHHMVITDAGCAGRFGSLVTDAELPTIATEPKERCLFFHDGSCLECVLHCPVGALDEHNHLEKQRCWSRCLDVAREFQHIPWHRPPGQVGKAEVCGKCAVGPCSFESAV